MCRANGSYFDVLPSSSSRCGVIGSLRARRDFRLAELELREYVAVVFQHLPQVRMLVARRALELRENANGASK